MTPSSGKHVAISAGLAVQMPLVLIVLRIAFLVLSVGKK